MTHQISWPVPDHVVMVKVSGGVNAQEAQSIADEVYTMIDSVAAPMINFLIHSSEASIDDKLWNYGKLKLQRHPKVNLVIVIGDSRIYGLIVAIITKMLSIHIQYSDSVDAALKIISGLDLAVAEYLDKPENMR
jgi:hypothetical protein